MAGMMGGMMGEEGGAAAPPEPQKMPLEIDKYKAKAAKMGDGVTYVSAKNVEKDGSQGVRVVYKFEDITTLQVSTSPDTPSQGGGMGMGEAEAEAEPEPPVTFGFKPGKRATLTVNIPHDADAGADDGMGGMDEDFGGLEEDFEDMEGDVEMGGAPGGMEGGEEMMKMMFAGMRMRMLVKVMGDITDSNATYIQKGSKSGKRNFVTLFDMKIGDLLSNPENFMKLEALGPESDLATAKEALKGIPGIKIETEQQVEITFE